MKKILIVLFIPAALIGLCSVLVFYSQVDNTVTTDDIKYINKIIGTDIFENKISSYTDEINFIDYIQKKVLDAAPLNKSLLYKSEREPKNLYLAKHGLCYDRSRVIEKILTAAGFNTRHIVIFKNPEKINPVLKILDIKKHASHAVTEVQTFKGWLVIDSNEGFISIDKEGNPFSIYMISEYARKGIDIRWKDCYQKNFNVLFKNNFIFVYGLYSRHGEFYPPYNFVPDINWQEFFQNFTD